MRTLDASPPVRRLSAAFVLLAARLLRLALGLLGGLLVLHVPAFAQSNTVVVPALTAPGVVRSTLSPPVTGSDLSRLLAGRSYIPPGSTTEDGSRLLRDLLRGPGPASAGGSIEVAVSRRVAWGAIAKGIGRGVPAVGTAIFVADLLRDIRCKNPAAEGAWYCDDGRDLEDRYQYIKGNAGPPFYDTPSDARTPDSCNTSNCTTYTWGATGQSAPFSGTYYINGTPTLFTDAVYVYMPYTYEIRSRSNGSLVTSGSGTVTVVRLKIGQQCPAYTDENGVPHIAGSVPPGPDGKCPSGSYRSKSQTDVENKTRDYGNKGKAGDYLDALDRNGVGVDTDPPVFEGPGSIAGGRKTTTNPDGSTTVEDTDYPFTYDPVGPGAGYRWEERTSRQTYGPGATIPPPPTPGTPTTTTPPPGGTVVTAPPSTDLKTCGLPGTPPCKIDETGTPTAEPRNPEADATAGVAGIKSILDNIGSYTFPTIEWSFALPTGCAVIPLTAFEPFLSSLDICQFQPEFHDLMSVVWVLGGLFGAIGIFWRDQLQAV